MADKKSKDYVEIRIPKITGSFPIFYIIPLMLVSFLLGGLSIWLWNNNTQDTNTPITSATGAFVSYAGKLGMNKKDFQACLSSNKYASKVQEDISAGTAVNVNATPTFFVNGKQIVGAQPYSVFKQTIDAELSKGGKTSSLFHLIPQAFAQVTDTFLSQPAGDVSVTPTPAIYTVENGHLPLLGKKQAKVTVVEFSDFQCPFCERFFTDSYNQLKKDYIDTGKIEFAYRQFPLTSIHPNAEIAAEAAECAQEQGKFWQMHDKLFSTQSVWSQLPKEDVK